MSRATRVDMENTVTMVCDILDVYSADARLLDAGLFADFGGVTAFHGPVTTIKCFEDNSQVRPAVESPGRDEHGRGRVLVIDGGGSLRTSLVGGILAGKAAANGWAGIVVFGAVRDVAELEDIELGIKALAPCPRSSDKLGAGQRDVPVTFAGQTISPGDYLYADGDGIIVASRALHAG